MQTMPLAMLATPLSSAAVAVSSPASYSSGRWNQRCFELVAEASEVDVRAVSGCWLGTASWRSGSAGHRFRTADRICSSPRPGAFLCPCLGGAKPVVLAFDAAAYSLQLQDFWSLMHQPCQLSQHYRWSLLCFCRQMA